MNRAILFRGERFDIVEWVKRGLVNLADKIMYRETGHPSNPMLSVDPDTVGQYTGLIDKNGKRVFEGDVMEFMRSSATSMTNRELTEEKCVCKEYGLEKGDTLYISTSWDGGIGFDYIHNIKFCPVCGKELPEWRK